MSFKVKFDNLRGWSEYCNSDPLPEQEFQTDNTGRLREEIAEWLRGPFGTKGIIVVRLDDRSKTGVVLHDGMEVADLTFEGLTPADGIEWTKRYYHKEAEQIADLLRLAADNFPRQAGKLPHASWATTAGNAVSQLHQMLGSLGPHLAELVSTASILDRED